MRRLTCLFALNVLLAHVNPRMLTAQDRSFATIDVAGALSTAALDINAAGEIVGSYNDATGTHGFVLSAAAGFASIDFPGAIFTRVAGINARGDVVGMYRLGTESTTVRHGFLLSKGVFTTIDPPGARFANALGINEWGDIVGRFCTTLPCRPEGTNVHGFVLSDGEFATVDVPGAIGTNAWKINALGEIVGGYTAADLHKRLFLLRMRTGDFATIDVAGTGEIALENGSINPRGDLVTVYCDAAPCRSANPGAYGLLLSGGEMSTLNVPGAISTNAFGINARGDVVGVYEDAAGIHAFFFGRN